jgi:hypothetical protein
MRDEIYTGVARVVNSWRGAGSYREAIGASFMLAVSVANS